jgi:hypothetical protein
MSLESQASSCCADLPGDRALCAISVPRPGPGQAWLIALRESSSRLFGGTPFGRPLAIFTAYVHAPRKDGIFDMPGVHKSFLRIGGKRPPPGELCVERKA